MPRLRLSRAVLGYVNATSTGRVCLRKIPNCSSIQNWTCRTIATTGRNKAQQQDNASSIRNTSNVNFDLPLQPIYANVPSDFPAFIKEVNKAFGNQWAPRSAFEEIYQFYLDRDPKKKRKVALMKKRMSEDYMTTYMLDAIENGGMEFIRSLGPQWKPLREILQRMSLNQRRSFCCKILYQRMKEMRLEELAKAAIQPKSFIRETTSLTPEERKEAQEDADWEQALPQNVRDAYLAPKKLNAPYNVTVAQLQIRGHYLPPVDFMADFCLRAAYHFGLPATGPVPLPRRVQRWTVIKAPFIFKKSQENFERRTFARLVTIKDGHPDVVEMWLSYCVRNMFHGTGMKVNMFTNDYVGVGKSMDADIKRLIEQERWAVDGYNHLHDDAKQLQSTIDMEIKRIESQMAKRDDTERARRILHRRVNQLLQLEGQAEREAQETLVKEASKKSSADEEDMSRDAIEEKREMRLKDLRSEAMRSLAKKLPALDVEELQKEVEWDKQQDEALRKHLLHVGKYAQQKGIAPLTREEYFTYVPFVLLPKYKGIHKDVFDKLDELDLLRIPKGNAGYLSDWDNLTERKRYDLVFKNRQQDADRTTVQSDKIDTSRLERMVQRRRKRRMSTFDAQFEAALEKSSAQKSTPTEPVKASRATVSDDSTREAMLSFGQLRSDQVEVDEQTASTDSVTSESTDAGIASGVEENLQAQADEVASATTQEEVLSSPTDGTEEAEAEEVKDDVSSATTEEVQNLSAEDIQVEPEEVKDDVVADADSGATKTELVDETELQGEVEDSVKEESPENNSTPKT